TVTGRITDDKGTGFPNASVTVKGTRIGTVTGADGSFSISVPANASTLVVSSVGFGNQEVAINNRTTLDVTLTASTSALDEVVVVGYQTRRKIDEAGAISTVRAADIENQPNVSLDKALQGRAAGVLVQSNNGIPGGAINVRIRGTGSFQAGTQPLYIVDGVQLNTRNDASFTQSNPLSFLNPNDIESIDVLKDASASIYGASAANGVVIITTKKGRAGKTKFQFNTYAGQARAIKKFDVLNSQEYVQLRVEAYQNANLTSSSLAIKNVVLGELRQPNAYGTDKSADSAIALLPTTDFQDAVFRNARIQNYEASASGGNDRTTFRIGSSFTTQEAILSKADFNRGTLKLDLTNKATDKLSITTSLNLSTAKQTIPFSVDGSSLGSPAFSASLILPTNQIYKADGSYAGIPPENFAGALNQNIVAVNEYNTGYNRTNQAVGNLSFDYKFADWISFRSFYGIDYRLVQGESYRDPRTPDGFNRRGLGQVQSNWNTNFITFQTFNLNTTINNLHRIDGVLGAEYKRENNEGISASAENFPSFQFRTINSAAVPLSSGGFFTGFRRLGFFSTANYSYDGRFIINGMIRYDYSSRFGENNPWGLFPAVKVAWNIDREKFMETQNTISQFRLRASYGTTGNDQIGNFDSRGLFGSGTVYNGAAGINYTQLANPTLKWEVVRLANVGVELGLFRNRVTAILEIYSKLTTDALLDQPVQQTTGFSAFTSNIG
ncbi:MAG TPA: SusC/RagA family TonB-linked outer membrane protein, partial [Flavisolibacter sp.]|nr:SusC/RagA family TonB-linked outer membrane protein [Flavisolibacter sp.]